MRYRAIEIKLLFYYLKLLLCIFFVERVLLTNQQNDRLQVGLLAQVLEHCISIAEAMGSNLSLFTVPCFSIGLWRLVRKCTLIELLYPGFARRYNQNGGSSIERESPTEKN